MAEGPYLMGIDGGTDSVRVGIFDREGTLIAFGGEAYSLKHPHPGWAEQDSDEWWTCLVAAVKRAMSESGVSPEEIAGISLDTTSLHGHGRAGPPHAARDHLDGRTRGGSGPPRWRFSAPSSA